MTLYDDSPLKPPDENLPAQPAPEPTAEFVPPESPTPHLSGDPISYAALTPAPYARPSLPEDLRIPWSWVHLVVFLVFGFGSLLVVQLGGVLLLSANKHLSQKQLQQLIESKPQFLVATNILWFALIFLFLYVTLSVLRGLPFWRTLGWKKLNTDPIAGKGSPWMYFFSGCGLAIFVAIASSRVKNVDHVPIQELFKSRTGAMLLMAMAVFVAPLVEETVFRGYLYPLFAKSLGILPGILITGALFGLMHGAQLGWTWGLVGLLTLVGVIFTFVRARTGTVVASFLLHLGYNSMIAVTSIIATKGFTQMPPHP
jgi:membrane protease YdiL (CAAX protease family)